jgi:plasmid rolling circle replication initiator protein Rep
VVVKYEQHFSRVETHVLFVKDKTALFQSNLIISAKNFVRFWQKTLKGVYNIVRKSPRESGQCGEGENDKDER